MMEIMHSSDLNHPIWATITLFLLIPKNQIYPTMKPLNLTMPGKFFIAGIVLTVNVFILEITLPFHVLSTVGYIIVIIFILGFPRQIYNSIGLGLIATIFIFLGYFLRASEFVNEPDVLLNRVLSVLAIWLSVYFNLRFRKILEDDFEIREQLHAIFTNATEGMLVVNHDGQIVMANPFAEQLFGYSSGALSGRTVEELIPHSFIRIHPGHREAFMANRQNTPLERGKELIARHKNGKEFPVDISLTYFQNKKGSFVLAFILDLTERKNAIEKIKHEQHLAQKYFELASVLFVALDKNGNVMAINDYGCRLLGCTKEEIIGKHWFTKFVNPDIRDDLLNYFNKIFTSGHPENKLHNENPILNYSGEEIEISWRNSVIRDMQGNPIGVLSAGTDITEKKKQERMVIAHHAAIQNLNEHLEGKVRSRTAELNEVVHKLEKINLQLETNQRLLKTVVHHFPSGVIGVLNQDMKYIFADGQELHSLGLNREDNVGERLFDDLHPAISKDAEEKLKVVFGGSRVSFDVVMDKKDFTINSTPLPDEKGNIKEILVVIKNITDRKKIERDLLKSVEKEKELNVMKSRFVTMASHEFRTPLTTILSSVFLLENYTGQDLDDHKATHLGKIKRSVNNLTELLNDFISLGKLEEGKIKVVNTEINIRNFLDDLIPDMEMIRKGTQTIRCECSGDMEAISLDRQLLRSIFMNLIGNAVKYSPLDSEIKVFTEVTENRLIIKVVDRGMGIPEEDRHHIFKRFYRAQNAVNIQGTGLGLNITKKYVKLMKGKIDFQSKINEGTTFMVSIPLVKTLVGELSENEIQ